jgi:hypothetical protein
MIRKVVQAGSPQTLWYAFVAEDGSTHIMQDDVLAIELHVYDLSDDSETTPTGGEAIVVADAVYDTLQTIEGETFNIQIPISATYIPDGGHTYRAEVLVTLASGEARYLDHVEMQAEKTLSYTP